MSLTVNWPGGLNVNGPEWKTVSTTESLPSIVYCKKCKWRSNAICKLTYLSVGPNDYCSKGEEHEV